MKNPSAVRIIRERFTEQKMSAEYLLQLNKVVEKENAFVKDFSKNKWKEYFNLDLEKLNLHCIELDELIEFTIEFIKEIRL